MTEDTNIVQELDRWQEIFDAMMDWVLIISSDYKILRVNRTFRNYFGLTDEEIIGVKFYKLIHGLEAPIEGCPCARSLVSTIYEESEIIDHGRTYTVTASPMFNDGKIVGFQGIARDITARKEIESERESLITELREALSKIKTLSGLLPICASCKKVRDDNGYWNQIETYISAHSDADFSHSICPSCVKELYPQLNAATRGDA